MSSEGNIAGKGKRVRLYLDEGDHWEGGPLFVRLLEALRAEGCAGATVWRGIAGFGASSHIHTTTIVDLSAELPLVVEWVDTPERVERVLPKVRGMLSSGLVTVDDVDAVFWGPRRVEDIGSSVKVAEVMTREVVSVRPETPLHEVVQMLLRGRQRAVPVVDAERKVVGIVTNGDLVERGGLRVRVEMLPSLTQEMLGDVLASLEVGRTVADILTRQVLTVGADASLAEAAHLMVSRGVKRLPVVDGDGRLQGIVSRVDILRVHSAAYGRAAAEQVPTAGTTVGEVMRTDVPVVGRSAALAELLDAVVSTRLNRALVVDEEHRLVGIVSDAELTLRLSPRDRPGAVRVLMSRMPFANLSAAERRDVERATGSTAESLMVADIESVTADTPLTEAVAAMLRRSQKVLPVVDAEGRLLGAVDRADLLRILAAPS